jgi:hypothetical protein
MLMPKKVFVIHLLGIHKENKKTLADRLSRACELVTLLSRSDLVLFLSVFSEFVRDGEHRF